MSRGWIAQHSRRKVREHDNSSPVCWLERFPYKEDVIGSSPVGPTSSTGSDGLPLPDRSVLVGVFLVQLFLRLG